MTKSSAIFWMGGLFLASVVTRAWLNGFLSAPFIFLDELRHLSLMRGIWGGVGSFWGTQPANFPCWLYPALMSPLAGGMKFLPALSLMRFLNCVAVSLTLPAVYGLAREAGSRRRALAAAALTALMPQMGYTANLLAENLFLPVYSVGLWLTFRAVIRPSIGRAIAAGLWFGLAFHVKIHGLFLPPIYAVCVLIHEGRRLALGGFGKVALNSFMGRVAIHAGAAVAWAAGLSPRLLIMIFVDHIPHPANAGSFLGVYASLGSGDYSPTDAGSFGRLFLKYFFVMLIGIGFFPLIAALRNLSNGCDPPKRIGFGFSRWWPLPELL
ncbi:glycosyltransferase family 39 protein [Candidatus Sumerlaeota bacterium]|nr:glycosyltransferase family 39 protein [Candidatus Sumerlaeota bacterium]